VVTFETDPDLMDVELNEALTAIADFLKQHPHISCVQIRLDRFLAGAEVAAPNDRRACMKVARATGGRWVISERNDPPRRGLLSLLDGY
jgi:hypothetical protein